jgi:pimeloyl-ACP methyl ester carboxylesterase
MKRLMVLSIYIILFSFAILYAVLCAWSPGTQKPFLDKSGQPLPGSISEKLRVLVNGVEQGMFIKGKNRSKPVLLFVHGGMPEYFLTQKYPTGLEDYFVVVWWEQRATGLSFNPNASNEVITIEQLVSDLIEVTNYLRQRFDQEKIYLMAHSGGSFIGIQAAAEAPGLFHAYIGVAQISNQLKSEKQAYEYMRLQYKTKGDSQMVRRLEAVPVTLENGVPNAYYALRDKAMHSLGIGTTHEMRSIVTGVFLPSLQFREYTLAEKINLWRAKAASGVSIIWQAIMTTDLTKKVTELSIPVYFFHGSYDYTCSYTEAKLYFDKLKAPTKGFYTFTNSAHSPFLEEPEKTQLILREDVLWGLADLADKHD